MRRNADELRTLLLRFPDRLPRLDAELLGKLILSEDDPVTFFRIAGYRDRKRTDRRIEEAFHRCKKTVEIHMQYSSAHMSLLHIFLIFEHLFVFTL